MRHIISAVVENKPGVLARISGLICARGFNIESLAVGETENPEWSRMTIVVSGDEAILEQVRKQLSKLIDTLKVTDLTGIPLVERDLVLVKFKVPAPRRGEVMDLAKIFDAKILDITEKTLMVEVSGDEEKIDSFLRLVRPYGIAEMARTGRIALKRGD